MKQIEWSSLGFSFMETDAMFLARYKDGSWEDGELVRNNTLSLSISSTALHYGQQCFEGLKAFTMADGRIGIFRPDENGKRLARSCKRVLMPEVPQEMFLEACNRVVAANRDYIPPFGSGASLYLRPFVIGVGHNLGVKPAPEYLFCIFVSPVGPYFKGGMKPIRLTVSDYDRAAPVGTGADKVGGNYAASMLPHKIAVDAGFDDCIYLDPISHTKIEEVGAANFFGITHDNCFVTPKSPSILPSITRKSLIHLAKERLGMEVEEGDVLIDELDRFREAGACGTAAVISPIGSITYRGKEHLFGDGNRVGEKSKKLYDLLTGIQDGREEDPGDWMRIVPL